jgi:dephospho-CoA kinase
VPASDESSTERAAAEGSPGVRPPVIGLTGATAAGKSTVADALGRAGCHVVDVDALGHRALELPDVRRKVAEEFGTGILDENGAIDRGALARLAFRSATALSKLEEIVHPRVREQIQKELERAAEANARAAVVDCALLFEGGLDAHCDTTVVVHAPDERRTQWAKSSRGWDTGEIPRREALQLSPDGKRARAERLLMNDADVASLEQAALAMLDEIAPRPGARAEADENGN